MSNKILSHSHTSIIFFSVNFDVAHQAKSPEQILGVVDGAVVSADNDTGKDGMIVTAVSFAATDPP